MKFNAMFQPIQIGPMTVKNRFVVPPMGNNFANTDGTMSDQSVAYYATRAKGPRYLNLAEGYILRQALDENDEIIGYEYVNMGVFMENVKKGVDPKEALEKAKKTYGRFADAVKYIDPRKE